jgi:hypothetical protein
MDTIDCAGPDAAKAVLNLLGSLWRYYYGGRAQILTMVQANLELVKQQQQNLTEVAACASRFTVPLYHTENWELLYVLRGPKNEAVLHKSPGLVELPLLMDKLVDPTVLLHEGIDYRIRGNKIEFANDDMLADVDALWGFKAKFDRGFLWKHFGHLVGLKEKTSQQYKDTINAIIDCWMYGPTTPRLEALVAAVLGVPCADGEETICGRYEDRRGPFVVTDLRVHRIPQEAILSHSEGSQPRSGAPLVKSFEIHQVRGPDDSGASARGVRILVAPEYDNEKLEKIIRMVFPPFINMTFGRL